MRREMGRRAETRAADYLQQKGYTIVDRNYYTRYGELDIICEQGDTIVFVEVRSKRSSTFGTPEESITSAKIARLRKTALSWLAEKGTRWYPNLRFDVVTIRKEVGNTIINHIEGAF
ncbi:MAG: YraN family protein [Syntrophothermaceae bacterium]